MSLIKKMRRQRAVYWKRLSADPTGMPVFDNPVEIECRWERDMGSNKFEQMITPGGTSESIRSTVYVDRDMSTGDMLLDARLQDIDIGRTPLELNALEIHGIASIPTLRATESLRIAYI